MTTKKQTASAATKSEREIATECPKCHDLKSVKGLFWDDLVALGIDTKGEPRIERLCSACRYRQTYKSKPLTEEQKAKRREYQKKRRERVNHALALAKAQAAVDQPSVSQNGATDEPAE